MIRDNDFMHNSRTNGLEAELWPDHCELNMKGPIITLEEVLKDKKSELKKATIYLTKRHTGITNKQIGELFGGISYSGIAKVYQRFAKQLKGEKALKKRVSKIEMLLSSVKG